MSRIRIYLLIVALSILFTVDARAECVGNIADPFGDGIIDPIWEVSTGSLGEITETDGRLNYHRFDGVSGAINVRLSQSQGLQVCGDFDIRVDYALDLWPAATSGKGRFHPLLLRKVGTNELVAGVERYSEIPNSCIPFQESYKMYTTNPGCADVAVYIATNDLAGKFRITRQGSTVRAFYWSNITQDWIEGMNRPITTEPVYLILNSGTAAGLNIGHHASYDNLSVASAADPLGSTAGEVTGLSVEENGTDITLSWQPSCDLTDSDYEVYEGFIGDFTTHQYRYCSTGGVSSITLFPSAGGTYYLVVPRKAVSEGSYGQRSDASERSQAIAPCFSQAISPCAQVGNRPSQK